MNELIVDIETEFGAVIFQEEQINYFMSDEALGIEFCDTMIEFVSQEFEQQTKESYIKRLNDLRAKIVEEKDRMYVEYDEENYFLVDIDDTSKTTIIEDLEEMITDYEGYFTEEQIDGITAVIDKVNVSEQFTLEEVERELDMYNALQLPELKKFSEESEYTYDYLDLSEVESTQVSNLSLSNRSSLSNTEDEEADKLEYKEARRITYRKKNWYSSTRIEEEKQIKRQVKYGQKDECKEVRKGYWKWEYHSWRNFGWFWRYKTVEECKKVTDYSRELSSKYIWSQSAELSRFELKNRRNVTNVFDSNLYEIRNDIGDYLRYGVRGTILGAVLDTDVVIYNKDTYDEVMSVNYLMGMYKDIVITKRNHYWRNDYNLKFSDIDSLPKYIYIEGNGKMSISQPNDYVDKYGNRNEAKYIRLEKKEDKDSYYHRMIGVNGEDNTGNVKYVSDGGYFEVVYDKNGRVVKDGLNGGTYNYGVGKKVKIIICLEIIQQTIQYTILSHIFIGEIAQETQVN